MRFESAVNYREASSPRRALAGTVVFAAALLAAVPLRAECPGADDLQEKITKVFHREVKVEAVNPTRLDGVCEVVAVIQGRKNIVYADGAGELLITGHLLDLGSGRDLTKESLDDLNRFTADEVKRLDGLTALTLGEGGSPVYFVTDPQ